MLTSTPDGTKHTVFVSSVPSMARHDSRLICTYTLIIQSTLLQRPTLQKRESIRKALFVLSCLTKAKQSRFFKWSNAFSRYSPIPAWLYNKLLPYNACSKIKMFEPLKFYNQFTILNKAMCCCFTFCTKFQNVGTVTIVYWP